MSLTQGWGPVHPSQNLLFLLRRWGCWPQERRDQTVQVQIPAPCHRCGGVWPGAVILLAPLLPPIHSHSPYLPTVHFPGVCSEVTSSRQPARSPPLCSSSTWASPHNKLLWLLVTPWGTGPVSGYSHPHKTHTWRHTQASASPSISEPPAWNPD